MTARPATKPPPATRRSAARLAAVQALYQAELTATPVAGIIGEFVDHRLGREIEGETYHAADGEFFSDLVRGTTERGPQIDELIAGALVEGWTVERLDSTLRAALRAGTYELVARPDVPARVVISEYVDVARAFFGGREPGLLNGVLDRLGRRLRPGEMGTQNGAGGTEGG
jgi:N utilization substance protein B